MIHAQSSNRNPHSISEIRICDKSFDDRRDEAGNTRTRYQLTHFMISRVRAGSWRNHWQYSRFYYLYFISQMVRIRSDMTGMYVYINISINTYSSEYVAFVD